MNKKVTSLITEAGRAIRVTNYLDYRDYLARLYRFMKSNATRYSYLQLADDLGFSRTNVLHLIIKGKRPLTPKAAKRIMTALDLSDIDRLYLDRLVRYQNSRHAAEREVHFQRIVQIKSASLNKVNARLYLEFFSDWWNAVIYELMGLPEFVSEPHWISDRVCNRIRPEQARRSLDLMASLGLAKFDADQGRFIRAENRITTPQEISSMAIVRFHQHMIDLGKRSLTDVHEKKRDVTGVTVAIPEQMIPHLKHEIGQFRERILSLADTSQDANSVYQLNIQLFPVARLEKEK